jgi:hypothetical protein
MLRSLYTKTVTRAVGGQPRLTILKPCQKGVLLSIEMPKLYEYIKLFQNGTNNMSFAYTKQPHKCLKYLMLKYKNCSSLVFYTYSYGDTSLHAKTLAIICKSEKGHKSVKKEIKSYGTCVHHLR